MKFIFRNIQIQDILSNDGNVINILAMLKGKQILLKLQRKPIVTEDIITQLPDIVLKKIYESGAEYSYYDAENYFVHPLQYAVMPRSSHRKRIWRTKYDLEVISSPSKQQIERSLNTPKFIVRETPELYSSITQPYIQSILKDTKSIQWLYNILDGYEEQERILYRDTDDNTGFVLSIDSKWKNHPNCKDVPRNKWYNHESVNTLYCLAIVNRKDLHTIRDINANHLAMLKNIATVAPQIIEEIYGVHKTEIRIFIHYQPQFYHLHIHFTRFTNNMGCQVEHAHLLDDIIQNVEMDTNYYKKRAIIYALYENNQLYKNIMDAKIS